LYLSLKATLWTRQAFWNHLPEPFLYGVRHYRESRKERERESSEGHRCDRYTAEVHGIQANTRNEAYLVSGMRGIAAQDAGDEGRSRLLSRARFWNDASARGIPGRL